MMWYWGGGVHWWGWLLGFFGMIVFWGLLIWAVWYLVTSALHRPDRERRPPSRSDDALRILDERLARGEIDAEEYRHLRDLIRGEDAGGRRATAGAGDPGRQAPAGAGDGR